jgi:hypothetical protein
VTINRLLAIAALVLAVVSVFVAGPLLALACVCLALAVLL